MEKNLLHTAKVVGTATEKHWSQVHLFSPSENDKLDRRGQLLAVLSLKGINEGIEAVAAGREIISRLHEEYYGQLDKKIFHQLKEATQKVSLEVNPEAQIEIGAAVVANQYLYFAFLGPCRIYLQRQGKTGLILRGKEKMVTASGPLEKNDLYLLGTAGFFQPLAQGVLKAAMATGSAKETAELLAPVIHGQRESGSAAAVIFKISELAEKTSLLTTPKKEKLSVSEKIVVNRRTPPLASEPKTKRLKVKRRRILTANMKQFLNRLLSPWRSKLAEKVIYLKQEKLRGHRPGQRPQRSKKTIFTVVLILLSLLAISVALGAQQKKRQASQKGIASLLELAREKKEAGEALITLNPARAREILLESQALSQQIEAQGFTDPEYENFKKELANTLKQVLKEFQLEASLFFDLELIKQEARIDDAAVSGNKIIILDQAKPSIYQIDLNAQKKPTILAGGDLYQDASLITAFLPKVFVFTSKGIIEINNLTKKEAKVIEATDQWETAIDLKPFNNNLYLLTRDSQIWQFPATETGFGTQRLWLKEELAHGASEPLSMAIDSSIWILKADGQILKYTRGKKDVFGLAGLPEEKILTKTNRLYTDDDTENLYLLDSENAQIIVLAKTGEYQAAYSWRLPEENQERINDFFVLEGKKQIFLLGKNKLYLLKIES